MRRRVRGDLTGLCFARGKGKIPGDRGAESLWQPGPRQRHSRPTGLSLVILAGDFSDGAIRHTIPGSRPTCLKACQDPGAREAKPQQYRK